MTKVRFGYVSNSSSSSFILATKGNAADTEGFFSLLGITPTSPAAKLFGPLVQHLVDSDAFDVASYLDDFGYKTEEEFRQKYNSPGNPVVRALDLLKDGWTVRVVQGCNDSGDAADLYFYEYGHEEVDTPEMKVFERY